MKRLPRIIYLLQRQIWKLTHPLTLGVRVLLLQGNSILLVKHTYQREWYLPGGGVKKHETLEQAIRREACEEVGADLGELSLLGIYSNFYESKSDHVVVFVCRDFSLSEHPSTEIADTCFFDLESLPGDVSPGTCRRITEYLSGNPGSIVAMW